MIFPNLWRDGGMGVFPDDRPAQRGEDTEHIVDGERLDYIGSCGKV